LSGFDLIEKLKKQAENFGAEFKIGDVKGVTEVKNKTQWQIELEEDKITTLSVIVATGARPNKLGITGEDKLKGKGVSYCAVCDAALFKGKHVVVVGGGDTAIEEAIFLTKFADKVTVIHRKSRLRATKILQERTRENKKVEFIWDSIATEVKGSDKVEAIKIQNIKSKKEKDLPCDGVFIFVGYIPNTDFIKRTADLDEKGYMLANENMETSKSGIFAAGDVRKKLLRQVVTATGDGATAAFAARMYIEKLKGTEYK